MFVTRKNYDKLMQETLAYKRAFIKERTERNELTVEFNELMTKWNARSNNSRNVSVQLDQTSIKKLITLCHPDKHGGKRSAVEATQLLLSLRK